jgi:hypothetical protein
VDLRLALPELGRQPTLNLQMIEMQLDFGDAPGKIAADIVHTHVESDYGEAFAFRFDHHNYLLFSVD